MAKAIKQAKWDCTTEGLLKGLFPGDVSIELDLTRLFPEFSKYNEAKQFFIAYGFKQKCMDLSSDPKWTYQEKADRATELYNYVVANGKMPKTERKGGFGISKKSITEKIEKRDKPLTANQKALLEELGLI